MTSASELFYTRRSRWGRSNPDLGFDRSSQYSHGYRRHRCDPHVPHHHRRDLGGGDPLRRSLHVSHHAERASGRLDQSTSQLVSSNSANTESLSRPRLSENERLPGAVLLARERLLERLRGVPLSGNRRSSRPSPYIYHSEPTLEEDIRGLFDHVQDTGTRISTGQSESSSSTITELTTQIERLQLLQEPKKKPPGLTQEALDCLRLEVFSSTVEGVAPKASHDCSICLETLLEGDELIRLPCGHRFHSACLDPWVRTCGDCPYCRRCIVVNSHRAMKTT